MEELAAALRAPRSARQRLPTKPMLPTARPRRKLVVALVAAVLALVVGGVAGKLWHRAARPPVAAPPSPAAVVAQVVNPEAVQPSAAPPAPAPPASAPPAPIAHAPAKTPKPVVKPIAKRKNAKSTAPASDSSDPQHLRLIAPTFGDGH
jgi:hypothetical protein